MRNRIGCALGAAALVLGLGVPKAQSQVNVGRISGTVTDSTGATLPGVTVTTTHDETRFIQNAVTDSKGAYVVTHLPIGRYTIAAELQGFKKTVKSGYELETDGRITVNFTLELGAHTETLEVVAEIGEVVNTVSGEIARVIDSDQVQNMALNGRNYLELATLIPGAPVLTDDPIDNMIGLGINTVVNGSRNNQSNLTVDGGFNMDSGSNGSQINNVGIDFIQEVSIKTSNFSAEYGRQSGANINVRTRSGTNKFKGGARWFKRDERFDATHTFLKRDEKEKRPQEFDNYGWNLGGPVKQDKLFFFVGQEWKRVRRFTEPVRRTLPTSAELKGDFSGRATVFLKDPLKTGTCNATDQTACFPNPKVVPADRITADGRAIANLFARMQQQAASFTDTPTGNNASFDSLRPYDNMQNIARIDWNASQRHQLYARVIADNYEVIDPFGTFIGSQLPTTPTLRDRPGRGIQLGHTWHLSPSVINEFKASTSWNSQRLQPQGDVWMRDTYGFQFPQIYTDGGRFENAIPRVAVSGFGTAESMTRALISPTTDIAFHNTVTFSTGAHSLKAGAMYIRNRKDQNARTNYAGNVSFNPSGNPNSTGNAFADALLGNFRTYSEAELDLVTFFRFSQIDTFVSDSWRVGRNLSIEAGLRYQWHTPIYTQGNNIANFVPALYDPARAVRINPANGQIVPGSGNRYNGLVRAGDGVPQEELSRIPNGDSARVQGVPAGAPRGLYKNQHDFMPRFSFAWSPTGDGNLAVRGGIGVYNDRPEGNLIFTHAASPPFNESVSVENANLANVLTGRASALTPWGTIEATDPNLEVPRTTNWSLSVQRELTRGIFGEVAYVGAAGRDQIRRPDINAIPGDKLRASRALPSNQRPNDASLRPYAGFSGINMHLSDAWSDYHAFQTFVSKRRGDVNFTIAYTYGQAKSNANSRTDDGLEPGDDLYQGLKENYGRSPNHRRHIFALSYQYKMPFFRKSGGMVKTLLHGWEISGITHYQSGRTLTPDGSTSIGERRADYVGGEVSLPSAERGVDKWFNTDAFVVAPEDRKGNAPIGIVTGPSFQRWIMTLRKRTDLTSRLKLTLQLDAFNVFNHTNLGTPENTVTSSNFGKISSAGPPRELQLGVKLDF